MKELSKRVLKLVEKGNKKAFKKLVQHYQHTVYQFCYVVLGDEKKAEELATETFLYVYSHISEYLAEEKMFSLRLFKTVVCLSSDKFGLVNTTCHKDSFHETELQMYSTIALFLHYVHQLSFQEIGEVIDICKTEIRTYILHNQAILKEHLECKEQMQRTS